MLLGRNVITGVAAVGVSLLTAGGVVVLLGHDSTAGTTTNAETVTDGPTTAPKDVGMWAAASPSDVPPTVAPVTSPSSAVPTSSTRAGTTSTRRAQAAARGLRTHRASPRSTKRTTSTTASTTKRTTSSPRPSSKTTTASSGSATYEAQLLSLVNHERTSRGLSALKAASCPDGFAESWAKHLADSGSFEHQSLSPIMRACDATRVAENIARGDISAAAMVKLWMGSSGHRANILDPKLTQVGTAAVRGSSGAWTAVQVFIRP